MSDSQHESVKLNYSEWNKSYNLVKKSVDEKLTPRDERMFALIKDGLLACSSKKLKRALNVGPGPPQAAGEFVNSFLNTFDEIVLCEINPMYCKEYHKCDWYLENTSKIKIYTCDVNDFLINWDVSQKFDIIWMAQVMYFLRLNQYEPVLKGLHNLLANRKDSYMIVALAKEDEPVCTDVVSRCCPRFNVTKDFESCVKSLKFSYFWLFDVHYSPMLKEEGEQLLYLLTVESGYNNPDYWHNPGVIDHVEHEKIKQAIHDAWDKIFIKVPDSNDMYYFCEDSKYYFIKKHNMDKNKNFQSKL